MIKKIFPKLVLITLVLIAIEASAEVTTINVSVDDYNRFLLPEPYATVFFPPGSPLRSKPVALADNRGFMLLFDPNAIEPIQMVVELESGDTFSMKLIPKKNIAGVEYRYKNATGARSSSPVTMVGRPEDEWIVKVYKSILQGTDPEGFTRTNTTGVRKIGPINAESYAQWLSPSYEIYGFRLTSKESINIEPDDFYVDGAICALLDYDVVSLDHPNRLIIMMEARNGQTK